LELQQNLAVSVSTERKKDVMIEHLDKVSILWPFDIVYSVGREVHFEEI